MVLGTVMPSSQTSPARVFIPATAIVAVPAFSVMSTPAVTTATTSCHLPHSSPSNHLVWQERRQQLKKITPVSSTHSSAATSRNLNTQFLPHVASSNPLPRLEVKKRVSKERTRVSSSSTDTLVISHLQYPCGKVLMEETPQASHSDVTSLPPSSLLSPIPPLPKRKKKQMKMCAVSTPDAHQGKDKVMGTGHREVATASRHCTTGKARRTLF